MHSKSLLYESALRIAEKFKGGKISAPKNVKKLDFLGFLRKNLKLKNAYFGPFLIKNEKKKDGF